jgi:hypothetical protein
MVERRYGPIHIASLGYFLALYEVAVYGASKAGSRPDSNHGDRMGRIWVYVKRLCPEFSGRRSTCNTLTELREGRSS